MRAHVLSGLLAAGVLVGCGHTRVHEAILRPLDSPARREAAIYMAGQPLARPWYDVALVQAVGFGADATLERVTAALAARGGQIGCDAVVGVTVDEGQSLAHAYGVCVRFATGEPSPAPSAPSTRSPAPAPTDPDPRDESADEPAGGKPM